ncbi:acyl-CoA dehydrogenase [Bacillus pakistanensis]|uniref:Acyl-CoA dehydrogenase n=1 Tax=Rossellomorea pakistanensis TaxID=992288 RepID=A0ABS2N6U6_9BACI|nr:acyl-CoA dehydrogenase family protein [Bacillus pakistanensis]MBM7583570.1 acyl-CoA dehydrogenase [Bacillus pakistanensis]
MNETSEIIIQTAEKIMEDLCTKQVVDDAERGTNPMKLWNTLAETGMLAIGISEEEGGSDGGFIDALNVIQVSGKYSAPIPLSETILANWILSDAGLPISAKPMTVISNVNGKIAFTEKADGWVISGEAFDVPFARNSNSIVVVGKSEKGKIAASVNCDKCLITKGQNMANEARDHVILENILVSKEKVSSLKRFDEEKTQYSSALIRTVQMTGALENILELTIAYSKERTQFGRTISRFQAVQQQIAILAGEVSAAKAIANLAMKAYEAGDGKDQIMMAKIRVGEAASVGVPIAHQVHGAIGFTEEHSLQHSTRRLWSWRDECGNESDWAKRLGNKMLKLESEALWPYITAISNH